MANQMIKAAHSETILVDSNLSREVSGPLLRVSKSSEYTVDKNMNIEKELEDFTD